MDIYLCMKHLQPKQTKALKNIKKNELNFERFLEKNINKKV